MGMGVSALIRIAMIAAMLLLAGAGKAAIFVEVFIPTSGGGVVVDPCSGGGNQLDFTNSCSTIWAGH
jgi:hypothetical protein